MNEPQSPQEQYDEFLDLLHGRPEQKPQEASGFEVTDDSSADWCLKKLARLEARQARLAAFVANQKEKLEAFQARQSAEIQRSVEFFIAKLRPYGDQLVEEGVLTERQRSYKLPNGTLSLRKLPVEWQRDDAKLLAWAEANGLVRTTVVPDWAEIRKRLVPADAEVPFSAAVDVETGEIVEGVTVARSAREVFVPKPNLE